MYSTIHKATSSLVTGHFQKTASRNTPQRLFLPAAPIDSQWTLVFHRNCTSGNYGMAGNHEARGFVNSAGRGVHRA